MMIVTVITPFYPGTFQSSLFINLAETAIEITRASKIITARIRRMGKVMFSLCQFTIISGPMSLRGGVPQSLVPCPFQGDTLVSGHMSLPGGTPVSGSMSLLGKGVPQPCNRSWLGYHWPGLMYPLSPGQVTLRSVRLVRFPAEELSCLLFRRHTTHGY